MYVDDELLSRIAVKPALKGHHATPPSRIAIYSHDAQGLGHLRRNLLIARSLISEESMPSVLMISGLRETAAYDFPAGVDSVTLPSLGKSVDGRYYPRSLRLETREVIGMRSTLIRGAMESFRPDVLIVDKLPLGIFGELESALGWLREQPASRAVLGLRDILDEPEVVRREWEQTGCIEAMRALYDRVWVYGDRAVYDVAAEYALPADVAEKVRYAGYLNPRHVSAVRAAGPMTGPRLSEIMDLPTGSITLCVIGGGRDGLPVASEFLRAELPAGSGGVLVTGPLMEGEDRALLHGLVANRPDMRLIEFVTDPQPLICCADRVISMGGYNSVCEVLAFQKRALIVPRVSPRREQLIRAERLAARGLLEVLHPHDLSAAALSRWMQDDARPVRPAEDVIDFGGVWRLPQLLQELASGDAHWSIGVGRNGEAVHHG